MNPFTQLERIQRQLHDHEQQHSLDGEKLDQLAGLGASLKPLADWAIELQEGHEGFDNTERARRYEAVQEELHKAAQALVAACLLLQEELSTKVYDTRGAKQA